MLSCILSDLNSDSVDVLSVFEVIVDKLLICVRCLCVQRKEELSQVRCKHTFNFVPACKNCKCKVFFC